jgi:predicted SprT family Zn-dependent metalloprotease
MSVDVPLPPGNDLAAVAAWAVQVMHTFGLIAWRFDFNRRKTSLGRCRHGLRRIELSVHLIERNPPAEIRETLLHEIPHALVGRGHGHDAVWKAMCGRVGCKPERCGDADMPQGRWRAECGSCGRRLHRHRRPRRMEGWFCRRCGRERGVLAWRLDGGGAEGARVTAANVGREGTP